MDNSSIQVNGIEITRIHLITSENVKKVDLTEIVQEFNVYEAANQPFMTLDVLVRDALALTTRLPIIGSEMLDIEFKVPVSGMKEAPFQKIFRVLSIDKLDVNYQAREASYIIRCYDPAIFKDVTTKVQKSYSEKPVSDMVKDILKTYLEIDEKKITSSETEGTPTIVIPNLSPSEAIQSLLTRYARSKKYQDVSNYTFFSSQDGYKFTSYEDMIDIKNKPSDYYVDRYTLKEKNLSAEANDAINASQKARLEAKINSSGLDSPSESARRPKSKKPEEWLRMNDHVFLNKINIMDALRNGMLENTVYYINPTMRTFEKNSFNYVKDFEKLKALYMQTNKGKGFPVVETKSGEFKNLKGQTKEMFIVTNKGNQNVNESVQDNRYKHLGLSTASKAMLNSVIVQLTIPGDNTRKVGDLIELSFPEYGATDDIIGEEDAFISGMYLVTAVRHLYNIKHGYSCIMLCAKNCFEKDIAQVISQSQSQTTNQKGATASQNTPVTQGTTDRTGGTTPTSGTTPTR